MRRDVLGALCGGLLCVLFACAEDIRFAGDGGRSEVAPGVGADAGAHHGDGAAPAHAGFDAHVSVEDPHAASCSWQLTAADGFKPPSAASSCAGRVGSLFRYALCTCSDLKSPLPLQTDAFDSSIAPYAPGMSGGSVATNGRLTSAAGLEVRGSLIVAGAQESIVFVGAPSHVSDNVFLNAELSVNTAQLSIERDLWVNGRILTLAGALQVGGRILQLSADDNVGEIAASQGLRAQSVRIDPPCPCANVVDFAHMAERFAVDGDNALSRDALRSAPELALPCGRFALAGGLVASTTWRVDGRAAVFVDGDLELKHPLQVELADHAQLDVFVRGSLSLREGAEIVTARPAGLRFFVNGVAAIELPLGARFACSLYAPNAQLRTQDQQTIMGAFVVSELLAPVPLAIHYDAAVLRDPANTAQSCSQSCAADGDCQAPWICDADQCVGIH